MNEVKECWIGECIIGVWMRSGLNRYEYREIGGHTFEYYYGILNTAIPEHIDSDSVPKTLLSD